LLLEKMLGRKAKGMAEFMIEQYWTKARDGMGFQVLRSLFITRGWKGDAAAVL